MMVLGTMAAEVVALAVVRAVRAAQGLSGGQPAPSCGGRPVMKPHMPKAIRYTLVSIRDILISVGPFAIVAVALLVLAYLWLDPTPPKRVTLATGPAQSAYDEFGKRYKKALAANGIEVVLLPSQGSSDNLRLLREGKADLGFVQGGSNERATTEESGLESLGSLFVRTRVAVLSRGLGAQGDSHCTLSAAGPPQGAKPLGAAPRLLPQRGGQISALTQLQGLRLNIGTAGSGVPRLMEKLFEANNIDIKRDHAVRAGTDTGHRGLPGRRDRCHRVRIGARIADGADAAADAGREADGLRAERGLLPALSVSHAGGAAARRGGPGARHARRSDLRLVATTTALLTREQTHPALLQLFAQAARELHSPAGWFNRTGSFPTTEHSEYPVSPEAERAIKGGQPFLQRYLPFWLANLVERMWLALGIIIAILLPLSRIVPPLYEFRIRSRVFRWYGQLRAIENEMQAAGLRRGAAGAGTGRPGSQGRPHQRAAVVCR